MRIWFAILPSAFAALASGCASAPFVNPWAAPVSPAPGEAQSIGGYSAGCLQGATSLPPDGKGYQMMRLSRRRFYGHPKLIATLKALAEKAATRKLGPILIGDLGMARGGPMPTGHKSHQIGLDADIWFLRPEQARARSLDLDEREGISAVTMVAAGGLTIDPSRFGPREVALLRLASELPETERVFVNPAIKKSLCTSLKPGPSRLWLRKLRPWWGHDMHFHLRVRCPGESLHCEPQELIPEGDGCDDTLDWWFSDEAKAKLAAAEAKPKAPTLPRLPEACAAIAPPLEKP